MGRGSSLRFGKGAIVKIGAEAGTVSEMTKIITRLGVQRIWKDIGI